MPIIYLNIGLTTLNWNLVHARRMLFLPQKKVMAHCKYKKVLRETQTLRAGCSKAEPKIFAPPQTPSRGAGRPKFNQLNTVTTFAYSLQTQFGEDR